MSWMDAGGRAIVAMGILFGALFVALQFVSDPLHAFFLGGGSYIVGLATYSFWKVNVNKFAADASMILFVLPVLVILIELPWETTTQAVNATTNWFVSYFQGLPISIMSDLGGTVAAWILDL